MVTASAIALGLAVALVSAPDAEASDPARAVGSAMGKAGFPWYDARTDAVRPIKVRIDPEPESKSDSAKGRKGINSARFGPGDILPIAALVLGLVVLLAILAWSWGKYRPKPDDPGPVLTRGPGGTLSVGPLPEALRGASDPWQEAIRLRDQGDLAGAVLCLFAHQLLTLSRLDLIRLAPGRTGRQLVRSLADSEFRALIASTLRGFEAAYYGHRAPTAAEFAAIWADAEAFERLAAKANAGAPS